MIRDIYTFYYERRLFCEHCSTCAKGGINVTAIETARVITWMRAKGMSDTDACDLLSFVATGIGLPDDSEADN